jgi:uncharacterized protein YcbX
MPTIAALYRYPVKGLSAEPLARATLAAGGTIPFDRAYAIENGASGFDRLSPRTLPKINFLMLMRNESLAELDTRFDDASSTLTIRRQGAIVAEGNLDTPEGRRTIEAFFDTFSADDLRGPTTVLAAPGFSFSDSPRKVVSLINLETLRTMERDFGDAIDPVRFRGNILFEGSPAWQEFDWIGKTLNVGSATVEVIQRIERCAATNVNPHIAERDLNIPRSLMKRYGHAHCGVYATITGAGAIAVGDTIRPA